MASKGNGKERKSSKKSDSISSLSNSELPKPIERRITRAMSKIVQDKTETAPRKLKCKTNETSSNAKVYSLSAHWMKLLEYDYADITEELYTMCSVIWKVKYRQSSWMEGN